MLRDGRERKSEERTRRTDQRQRRWCLMRGMRKRKVGDVWWHDVRGRGCL